MSDRPSAVNGKRNRAWGTRDACPACGQCLCFGCHPAGPCVDEHDEHGLDAGASGEATYASPSSTAPASAGWYASTANAPGAAGMRMRSASDATRDRLP
jgi:hypothetical protein